MDTDIAVVSFRCRTIWYQFYTQSTFSARRWRTVLYVDLPKDKATETDWTALTYFS